MKHKPVDKLLNDEKINQVAMPKYLDAPPDISIERAVELMQEKRHGYVILTENKKVVGIFTETDLIRKVLGNKVSWDSPIRSVMSPKPILLTANDSVGKAIDIMGEHRFYHIPIVNDKEEITSVVSVRSIIRFLAEYYPDEVLNLPPDPDKIMDTPEGG